MLLRKCVNLQCDYFLLIFYSGSILLFCGRLPDKLNPLIKPLLESTKFCSNSFTRDILASAFCSLLDQVKERNPNLPQKLVKTFISFTTNNFQVIHWYNFGIQFSRSLNEQLLPLIKGEVLHFSPEQTMKI